MRCEQEESSTNLLVYALPNDLTRIVDAERGFKLPARVRRYQEVQIVCLVSAVQESTPDLVPHRPTDDFAPPVTRNRLPLPGGIDRCQAFVRRALIIPGDLKGGCDC